MPFPYRDLREFLDDLRSQGDLAKIEESIDVSREKNELAALQSHVAAIDGPCLWLENLVGYNTPGIPLVLNVFGSRRRMAAALGAKTELEAKLKLSRILNDMGSWLDPTIVNRGAAPCKEVVIRGSQIDLRTQIPHVWFGDERQSYPNCDITVSTDPVTGELNASTYRYGLMGVDPDGRPYPEAIQKSYMTAYAWWNPVYNDLGVHYSKAVKLGKPLDIAIAYVLDPTLFAIGGGPSILMGTHRWDKYALTGAVRGEPLELVKCEDSDLYVPAGAEYIIEGQIEVPPRQEPDGPHGNFLGYYDPAFILPLMKVNTITRRSKPIWYNVYEMWPPFDHGYVGVTFVAIEILAELKRKLPQVKDVVVHGGTWLPFVVVQLDCDREDKPFHWFGRHVIHAVWSAAGRFPRMMKYVVVVGPDIDPYNLTDVLIAMVTRTQPKRDFMFNDYGGALVLDPSAPRGPQGNTLVTEQVGIDATIKSPEVHAEFAKVARPSREEMDRIAKKVERYLKK